MVKLKPLLRIRLLILLLGLLFLLRGDGLSPRDFWGYQVDPFVGPYLFDWWDYETRTILQKLPPIGGAKGLAGEDMVQEVRGYFTLVAEIDRLSRAIQEARARGESADEIALLEEEREAWERERQRSEDLVEDILRWQVEEILIEEGIAFDLPLLGRQVFPPVEFEFQGSPLLLVISRRDRIETLDRISLVPTLRLAEVEELERRTDELGVSSLVVPTGGMGSYPPIIPETSPLPSVIGGVIHEWVHNYLYFYPLGQHYSDSQELITMNETVASLVEEELSLLLEKRYYPEIYAQRMEASGEAEERVEPGEFDFNAFMRETRLKVDELLAAGKIEEAETYMEERRKELVEKGYYIRKLNQAYFAFHGSYAAAPTSVSPIGGQMKELRKRSPSLAHFLRTVAQMKSYQDLLDALAGSP
ncbi:MAG: hypothetical protein ACE5LG_00425 [Anaerolineae bacterium]